MSEQGLHVESTPAGTPGADVAGVGLGLRSSLASSLFETQPPEVKWLEIHPENYVRRGGGFALNLERAMESWSIVPHGLTLGFGRLAPYDAAYTSALRRHLHKIRAPWYSDHLCFADVDGVFLHDLLPLPFTEEAVRNAVARITELRDRLELPIAVENVSFYAHPARPEMDEVQFLNEVVERAGCKLLLDVNNVYVNARNHGFDPRAYIDRIDPARVVQMHVAGHLTRADGLIIDTHGEALRDEVVELLGYTLERIGPTPVLLERDNHIPPLADLLAEVRVLTEVYERSVRRHVARQRQSAPRPGAAA